MARSIMYRDFTLAKAGLLCGLMVAAVLLGGTRPSAGVAGSELRGLHEIDGHRVVPVLVIKHADCASDTVGVAL